jgi:hypothetical protein
MFRMCERWTWSVSYYFSFWTFFSVRNEQPIGSISLHKFILCTYDYQIFVTHLSTTITRHVKSSQQSYFILSMFTPRPLLSRYCMVMKERTRLTKRLAIVYKVWQGWNGTCFLLLQQKEACLEVNYEQRCCTILWCTVHTTLIVLAGYDYMYFNVDVNMFMYCLLSHIKFVLSTLIFDCVRASPRASKWDSIWNFVQHCSRLAATPTTPSVAPLNCGAP